MFKHILIPTDGSTLSNKAVKRGLELARGMRARVTAIHVVPEFSFVPDEGMVSLSPELRAKLEEDSRRRARELLDGIGRQAKAKRVRCDSVVAVGDSPYEHIIETAKKKKCDLIVMASHGRRGLSSLLLGSETAKVLLHTQVPVLVVR
jgi:nucleotide-binding universal stress UspA family protein